MGADAKLMKELNFKPQKTGLIVNRVPDGKLDAGTLEEIRNQGLNPRKSLVRRLPMPMPTGSSTQGFPAACAAAAVRGSDQTRAGGPDRAERSDY